MMDNDNNDDDNNFKSSSLLCFLVLVLIIRDSVDDVVMVNITQMSGVQSFFLSATSLVFQTVLCVWVE